MDCVQKTLKELDNFLFICSQNGTRKEDSAMEKWENTIRYMNKNLNKKEILDYLKRPRNGLLYSDVIVGLFNSPELDPNTYN